MNIERNIILLDEHFFLYIKRMLFYKPVLHDQLQRVVGIRDRHLHIAINVLGRCMIDLSELSVSLHLSYLLRLLFHCLKTPKENENKNNTYIRQFVLVE